MTHADIIQIATKLIDLLVSGDFRAIADMSNNQRLSEEQLSAAIREYPFHLTMPPSSKLQDLVSTVEVRGSAPKAYSVWINLWTTEEGRSDLSLRLTLVEQINDTFGIQVDGILVP